MTEKELKKLGRRELIEILYEVQKQNDEKSEHIKKLQTELEDKTLRMDETGSIAEAAIKVNKVFEMAQASADQYLTSIRQVEAERELAQVAAEKKREDMLREAGMQAEEILNTAKKQADKMIEDAEQSVSEKWSCFTQCAKRLIADHAELQSLMREDGHK